jgi:hypothetical protein
VKLAIIWWLTAIDRFNLKMLNNMAVKEQYQVKVSNRLAALENFNNNNNNNNNNNPAMGTHLDMVGLSNPTQTSVWVKLSGLHTHVSNHGAQLPKKPQNNITAWEAPGHLWSHCWG